MKKTTRLQKVREAIKTLRQFHRMGRGVPTGAPGDRYGKGLVAAHAAEHHENEDTVRKARHFADPDRGYTAEELAELCALVESEQPDQDDACSVFGKSHLIRLLSVPKRRRAALQRLAIKGGWSTSRLDREIAKRFGTRREGGRRRQISGDVGEALVQIEGLCESWRRLVGRLNCQPAEEGHVALADLSGQIQKSIGRAGKAVAELHETIVGELRKHFPSREVRAVFRHEAEAARGADEANRKRRQTSGGKRT